MTETKLKSKDEDKTKSEDEDKIESSFWESKTGDNLVGKVEAIRLSKWGKDLYDIKTEDGIKTIKSSVVLRKLITKELLDKKIRVKYLGFKIGQGKYKYRDYEVYLVDE